MTKLKDPGTLPGWNGPLEVDLSDIQEALQEANYRKRPVNDLFLEYYAHELELVFRRVELNPNFVTADGRPWTTINFLSVRDLRFKLAVPRHEEGRTTGHASLYAQFECLPSEEEITGTVKGVLLFFRTSLRDFYWKR